MKPPGDIPVKTKAGKKFDYIRGFWAVSAAAIVLALGLVATGIIGAVNSDNRDDQITAESLQIRHLTSEIDALKAKYSNEVKTSQACAEAFYYMGEAYETLRQALIANDVEMQDIATINGYVTEATNAGCVAPSSSGSGSDS